MTIQSLITGSLPFMLTLILCLACKMNDKWRFQYQLPNLWKSWTNKHFQRFWDVRG